MRREDALRLVQDMRAMVGDLPGPIYDSAGRLKRIAFALNGCDGVTGYFREKVVAAVDFTGIWCSERRWRQWGDDPAGLHSIVLGNLWSLEQVIEQELKPKASGAVT